MMRQLGLCSLEVWELNLETETGLTKNKGSWKKCFVVRGCTFSLVSANTSC
jgi:hypothetical protein